MTVEERLTRLESECRRVRRMAFAGWTAALAVPLVVMAMGAAQDGQPRGLIARVELLEKGIKDLKQESGNMQEEIGGLKDGARNIQSALSAIKEHVHVASNGETTIVADQYLIPTADGDRWRDGIENVSCVSLSKTRIGDATCGGRLSIVRVPAGNQQATRLHSVALGIEPDNGVVRGGLRIRRIFETGLNTWIREFQEGQQGMSESGP